MSQGSVQARIEVTPRLSDLLLKVLGNKVVTSRWAVDLTILDNLRLQLVVTVSLCFVFPATEEK